MPPKPLFFSGPLLGACAALLLPVPELVRWHGLNVDLDGRVLSVRAQLARGTRARVEPKTDRAAREIEIDDGLLRDPSCLEATKPLPQHFVVVTRSGTPLDHRAAGRSSPRRDREEGWPGQPPDYEDHATSAPLHLREPPDRRRRGDESRLAAILDTRTRRSPAPSTRTRSSVATTESGRGHRCVPRSDPYAQLALIEVASARHGREGRETLMSRACNSLKREDARAAHQPAVGLGRRLSRRLPGRVVELEEFADRPASAAERSGCAQDARCSDRRRIDLQTPSRFRTCSHSSG